MSNIFSIIETVRDLKADLEPSIESILPMLAGGTITALGFLLKRAITRADKAKDDFDTTIQILKDGHTLNVKKTDELRGEISSLTNSVNGDIRLINKELGRFESSEAKQWLTHDSHLRELNDLKIRVAILETE